MFSLCLAKTSGHHLLFFPFSSSSSSSFSFSFPLHFPFSFPLITWPRRPGTQRTVTIRETVIGRLPLPGHYTESQLETHTQAFWERGLCALSRSFGLGEQFWFGTLRGLYGAIPRKQRPGDAIFVLSCCFTPAQWYFPERSLYICLVHWFLQLYSGNTPTLPDSRGQQGLSLWVPQDRNQLRKSS